jgi:hypothetical protein
VCKIVEELCTNFHKQTFLGFYESGSRRLLRVSGVGLLYLFQLRIPNLSCGPKNSNPEGLNGGSGTPSYWNQSEPTSHKCRCTRSSTKVQRTPSGKRSPYMVALPVLNYHVFRHRINADRRILVL